jgi:hypothetical protein
MVLALPARPRPQGGRMQYDIPGVRTFEFTKIIGLENI